MRCAEDAHKKRQLTEAIRRWTQVLDEFPDELAGYIGKGDVLRDLGRVDLAEVIFAEAMERFPQSEWPAARHAALSTSAQNWSVALLRWEEVREKFPDRPVGHIGRAEVLRELGRSEEAEQAFAAATRLFPDNEWAATYYAEAASRRRNWAEAYQRWQSVIAKFPNHPDGYVGISSALGAMDRLEEADTHLTEAMARFARHQWLVIAYAETAMKRDDWEEALPRWDLVIEQFPNLVQGYVGRAAALTKAGRLEDAKTALITAAALFPADNSVTQALATLPRNGPAN